MKLVPYSEYKDAEINWLGSMPAQWFEKRAKYYLKEIDERSKTGEELMLSVSHITGVTPRNQKNVTMFKAESNVGQKLCQPGDLIINTMWAWMSALGVSSYYGIVSPAYAVYRPRSALDYDNYYLDHLLRIEGYRSEYICRSTGIRSSRLRLYPDKFLSMRIICPPLSEQQAITRFLKAQDHLFRKFTRNKQRLIELLKEQKQNVINQAVTRGLDPNIKIKPSGVAWLGDIPEHWEARKLKFAAKMIVGGATPDSGKSELWDGDIVWVTPQDVSKNERLSSSSRNLTSAGVASCSAFLVPSGSIVVTSRAPVGNVSFAEVELCTNQGCKAFVPDEHYLLNEYSLILLKAMQPVFQKAANGTTFLEISTWAFENIKTPLPPLEEQQAIIAHIQKQSDEIDRVATRAQREIELMHEYRARLISDVVTGQVDVRGVEVPELAEGALPPLHKDAGENGDSIEASSENLWTTLEAGKSPSA